MKLEKKCFLSGLVASECREEEDETGEKEEDEAPVKETYKLPLPEERIALLPFDEMRTNYLQVKFSLSLAGFFISMIQW